MPVGLPGDREDSREDAPIPVIAVGGRARGLSCSHETVFSFSGEDPSVAPRIRASRLAAVVIGIAVLVGAGYWWFLRPLPSPAPATVAAAAPATRPVRTMTLGPVESGPVRSFPGRVQSARGRRVDVAFRVPGTIVELPLKTNQAVAKGQLLARLDPRDFETRLAQAAGAVAEARARLAAMQAGDRPEDIRILESQLAAEQARLREADLDFTRTRNLLERGAATKDALDRATRALEVAQATTAAATTIRSRARARARGSRTSRASGRSCGAWRRSSARRATRSTTPG